MKILITGATGFVGKKLVEGLIQEGHQLVITSRNIEKAQKELAYPCEFFQWNPVKELLPQSAFDDVDAVINLMGENIGDGRWSQQRKKRIRESRIIGTKNLIQSINNLSSSKVKKFISTSAIGFYGNTNEVEIDESSPLGKGFLADLCKDWEACLDSLNLEDNQKVILRFGIVLDDGGGALAKMLPPFMLGGGGRLGNGRQFMSWIHRSDLVNLISFSLQDNVHGILNATAPEPVNNREFTKVLATTINRPAIFPVPGIALKILLGEMSDMLLEGQRVLPKKALELGFQFKFKNLKSCLEACLKNRMAGEQELKTVIWVKKDTSDVFKFFSDEKNLEKITPDFLKFRVVGKSTKELKRGTLIDYRLKIRGIPAKWQSEIDLWEPGKAFVDKQIIGPYKKWHHLHSFQAYQGGTLVFDHVHYKIPGGFLGRLLLGGFIKRDVGMIFDYRQNIIKKIFS